MSHVPHLAADPRDDAAPRRSLILAGGGMRVAWQAGVLHAFEQAGLAFDHADGTSGGTINLAMLLSGLSPSEMCERWRNVRVRDFAAPLPLAHYLRIPRLAGLGGAGGITERVFPHLGIDVSQIRAATGIEGTFNVCNHARKVNEVIGHREIDLGALVAAISLPILMPAVERGGAAYTDSVWVKDANLMAAVKRGAEELWLVWCIGNTPEYRDGAFAQYVHMIEQSANGVLFEELDRIEELNRAIAGGHSPYGQRRPVTLHVVKPRHPLPLDPDFFLGRVDAATLVAMGFRDARRLGAIDAAPAAPLGPGATRMEEPGTRVTWRERNVGEPGSQLRLELGVEVPDASRFLRGPQRQASLVGRVTGPGLGEAILREGRVALDDRALVYDGEFEGDGGSLKLRARRAVRPGGSSLDRLRSLEWLDVRLGDRAARLRSEGRAPAGPLERLAVTNAPSTWARLSTAVRFRRVLVKELLSR
jgi:predicted acylesterase/phospholipase RssA